MVFRWHFSKGQFVLIGTQLSVSTSQLKDLISTKSLLIKFICFQESN